MIKLKIISLPCILRFPTPILIQTCGVKSTGKADQWSNKHMYIYHNFLSEILWENSQIYESGSSTSGTCCGKDTTSSSRLYNITGLKEKHCLHRALCLCTQTLFFCLCRNVSSLRKKRWTNERTYITVPLSLCLYIFSSIQEALSRMQQRWRIYLPGGMTHRYSY